MRAPRGLDSRVQRGAMANKSACYACFASKAHILMRQHCDIQHHAYLEPPISSAAKRQHVIDVRGLAHLQSVGSACNRNLYLSERAVAIAREGSNLGSSETTEKQR